MAEFCPECFRKIHNKEDDKTKYVLSDTLNLCEGCGEYKHVIIMEQKEYYMYNLRYLILPFKFIYKVIYVLWRILILPYLIYKDVKRRKGN